MKTLFEALAVLVGMAGVLVIYLIGVFISLGFYALVFAGAVWLVATIWQGVM